MFRQTTSDPSLTGLISPTLRQRRAPFLSSISRAFTGLLTLISSNRSVKHANMMVSFRYPYDFTPLFFIQYTYVMLYESSLFLRDMFYTKHFQVKNHGIPETTIDKIMGLAREFFRLPESERLKNYSDDPSKTTRLSTSFNVKTEKVSNWRDFLRIHCYPLEDYVDEWPSNPPSFRSVRGFLLIIFYQLI